MNVIKIIKLIIIMKIIKQLTTLRNNNSNSNDNDNINNENENDSNGNDN